MEFKLICTFLLIWINDGIIGCPEMKTYINSKQPGGVAFKQSAFTQLKCQQLCLDYGPCQAADFHKQTKECLLHIGTTATSQESNTCCTHYKKIPCKTTTPLVTPDWSAIGSQHRMRTPSMLDTISRINADISDVQFMNQSSTEPAVSDTTIQYNLTPMRTTVSKSQSVVEEEVTTEAMTMQSSPATPFRTTHPYRRTTPLSPIDKDEVKITADSDKIQDGEKVRLKFEESDEDVMLSSEVDNDEIDGFQNGPEVTDVSKEGTMGENLEESQGNTTNDGLDNEEDLKDESDEETLPEEDVEGENINSNTSAGENEDDFTFDKDIEADDAGNVEKETTDLSTSTFKSEDDMSFDTAIDVDNTGDMSKEANTDDIKIPKENDVAIPNMVHCYTMIQNASQQGGDIYEGHNEDDCLELCTDSVNCIAVDFNRHFNSCWIHSYTNETSHEKDEPCCNHFKKDSCGDDSWYNLNDTESYKIDYISNNNTADPEMHIEVGCLRIYLNSSKMGGVTYSDQTAESCQELCFKGGNCASVDYDHVHKSCWMHLEGEEKKLQRNQSCCTHYEKDVCNVDFLLKNTTDNCSDSLTLFKLTHGVNQLGGRLEKGTYTEETCRDLCFEDEECKGVDYSNWDSTCWTHNHMNPEMLKKSPCCEHYEKMKVCQGECYFKTKSHKKIGGDVYRVLDEAGCKSLCSGNQNCTGYTFEKAGTLCTIHDSSGQADQLVHDDCCDFFNRTQCFPYAHGDILTDPTVPPTGSTTTEIVMPVFPDFSIPPPNPDAEETPDENKGGFKLSTTSIIVIAVCAGVLVLTFVILIVIACVKRSKRRERSGLVVSKSSPRNPNVWMRDYSNNGFRNPVYSVNEGEVVLEPLPKTPHRLPRAHTSSRPHSRTNIPRGYHTDIDHNQRRAYSPGPHSVRSNTRLIPDDGSSFPDGHSSIAPSLHNYGTMQSHITYDDGYHQWTEPTSVHLPRTQSAPSINEGVVYGPNEEEVVFDRRGVVYDRRPQHEHRHYNGVYPY